jgi:hypothetical protein
MGASEGWFQARRAAVSRGAVTSLDTVRFSEAFNLANNSGKCVLAGQDTGKI